MSRHPRFIFPGQPQHVIQRGNNRDVTFVSDDDYIFYFEKLEAACIGQARCGKVDTKRRCWIRRLIC